MTVDLFHCAHRVSYAECTAGNHLYHARFLDILERARGELFRHLGTPLVELQAQDTIFAVTGCEMKFTAMARYDDLLRIELWLTALSGARFSCASRIINQEGTVLHQAVILLACTTVEGRPRRIPPTLARALAAHLREDVPL